jgi:putative GTP pyrophosphokinase
VIKVELQGNSTVTENEYLTDSADAWNTFMLLYSSALKEMSTKVEILNDEFQHVHQYNPIEYVKKRRKTPESIVKKLQRHNLEVSVENMVEHINDVAGIRIVCSFTSDIYRLADMIASQDDLTVLEVKDYIKYPKASGYKSYHMIVTVPVFLSDRVVDTKVEVQIRTIAMDFWASLDHHLRYKKNVKDIESISEELKACAEIIAQTDEDMLRIRKRIFSDSQVLERKNLWAELEDIKD